MKSLAYTGVGAILYTFADAVWIRACDRARREHVPMRVYGCACVDECVCWRKRRGASVKFWMEEGIQMQTEWAFFLRKNRCDVEEWVFCFDDIVVDVTRAPITGCRQPRIPRLPSGSRHFRRRPTRMSYVASWFKSVYTLYTLDGSNAHTGTAGSGPRNRDAARTTVQS